VKPTELLEYMVGTPSVSGDERALADGLSAKLGDAGFDVERSGNNLWFSVGTGEPRLLVNSHIDTVPAAAGWTRDPFKPQWEGERLYGLGANDAKGCVAAMTRAATALQAEGGLDGEVVFAFTAEEEIGGQGIATILDKLGPLDAAVVGEPTGLSACVAQRGMLLLKGIAHGTAGHVAHAKDTSNAIHTAARDIARLAAMRFPAHPALGESRAQVTQIEGGKRRNQVPETCQFFVDIRTTPNLDHDELQAEIAAALDSEMIVHSARYRPKATPEGAPIRTAVVKAGAKDCIGSTTTSDWAFLGDIPAVKIGPGDTRRSHTADEYLERAELEEAAGFYTRAIKNYFKEAQRERAA
jgi:acetylornithine deacetylase